MKDLNINIGGPRDRARQNVSVRVHQGDRQGLDAHEVGRLVGELRTALAQSRLPAEEAKRIERHLASIEEESQAPQPLLEEITSSISSIQRLVQSAQILAPALITPLRSLAAGFGIPVGF